MAYCAQLCAVLGNLLPIKREGPTPIGWPLALRCGSHCQPVGLERHTERFPAGFLGSYQVACPISWPRHPARKQASVLSNRNRVAPIKTAGTFNVYPCAGTWSSLGAALYPGLAFIRARAVPCKCPAVLVEAARVELASYQAAACSRRA